MWNNGSPNDLINDDKFWKALDVVAEKTVDRTDLVVHGMNIKIYWAGNVLRIDIQE